MTDRDATQEFAIRNVLVNFTGGRLVPNVLDKIVDDICVEMRDSQTAWAFKEPTWVKTIVRRPNPGDMIVKRWANGSVWAGKYSGTDKDSSFDEWYLLP